MSGRLGLQRDGGPAEQHRDGGEGETAASASSPTSSFTRLLLERILLLLLLFCSCLPPLFPSPPLSFGSF